MDIGSHLQFAFDRVKNNPGFYCGGAAVLAAATGVIQLVSRLIGFVLTMGMGLVLQSSHLDPQIGMGLVGLLTFFVSLVLGLVTVPLMAGYFRGIGKELRGEPVSIGDVISAFDLAVPAILNYAAAYAAMFLGFLLCILPGVAVAPLLTMSLYFVANGRTQGLSAFQASWALLKANPMFIVWGFVTGLVGMVGLLACCVGVLFTGPVAAVALYRLYDEASGVDPRLGGGGPAAAPGYF